MLGRWGWGGGEVGCGDLFFLKSPLLVKSYVRISFTQVIKKEEKEAKIEPKEQKTVQASKRQSVRDLANKIKDQVHDGPVPPRKKGLCILNPF